MSYADGFPTIDATLNYTHDRRYVVTVEAPDGTVRQRTVTTLRAVGQAASEMGALALGLPAGHVLVNLRAEWPPWLHEGQVVRVRPSNDHRFADHRGGLAWIGFGLVDGGILVNGVDLDADGSSVGGVFAAEDVDDDQDFTPAELDRVQRAKAQSNEAGPRTRELRQRGVNDASDP